MTVQQGLAPAEAWEIIVAGAVVIDVRGPSETEAGTLPGAIVIPHEQIASELSQLPTDKSIPLLLYCGAGVRAEIARSVVSANGYSKVHNGGGYQGLVNYGRLQGLL